MDIRLNNDYNLVKTFEEIANHLDLLQVSHHGKYHMMENKKFGIRIFRNKGTEMLRYFHEIRLVDFNHKQHIFYNCDRTNRFYTLENNVKCYLDLFDNNHIIIMRQLRKFQAYIKTFKTI